MSGHNIGYQLHTQSLRKKDPGASGTITVTENLSFYPLTSATAETRTLARPTRDGDKVTIFMEVDAGDITLTVTGGYNEAGETTFVFSDPGQFIELVSTSVAGTYSWRKTSDHNIGNLSIADASVIEDLAQNLTATAAEINQAADVTGQVVTLSTTPIAITAADHHNRTMYITKTDGIAITLPTPVAGMKFKFVVGATIAAASTIKSGAGTHLMIGHAILGNDSDDTVVRWPALAASTLDTIDLFGTANSTGGIEGQVIMITALSSTRWLVEIVGDAAGTEATPFADTVA